ncbi:MAG: adenylate/guanylate cyclase domain-containing protein, partial [bacterium]
LIRRLSEEEAAVIVFDVVFAEPSVPEQDDLLAEAIRDAGNVVLAADVVYQERALFSQVMRVEPHGVFREAGATSGVASVTLDLDQVVRRVPGDSDALWRTVTDRYAQATGAAFPGPSGDLIRYLGPDHIFRYVSYYQALEPATFLPQGTFRDRIVFIGLDLKTSPEAGGAQGEMFATPFMAFTGWPMPGVEVQANLVVNALTGEGIREAPASAAAMAMFIAAAAAVLLMRRWRPLGSALAALALMAVLGAASWLLFVSIGLWVSISPSVIAVVLVYGAQGGGAFLHERRRKRQIRRAFKFYVSPQVVEEVIAHPEKLVLGGVRRDLTIMFTDLAGFTALSERLSPERVAEILNRYLTAMSGIVMRNGGTVDKFIGDAVMACWGAPLEDPYQAWQACQAALEMQEEMVRLREGMNASGGPPISMRIGIHSGPAVVGNMGSTERFDYTAIGDNVNLASRLEGVNKLYGTQVILSSSTVGHLDDGMPLRYVDRIRVTGRTEPIDIFTFCQDDELNRLSQLAVDAFRSGDWARSRDLWRECLEREPGDGVAMAYLRRMDQYGAVPPGPGWDPVTTIEEKL